MQKKIISIIIFIFFAVTLKAGKEKIHPAIKSALIPGFGESSLSRPSQSRFFKLLELTLWSTCIGFYKFSKHEKLQYQSYAAKYAGTNIVEKNHKYWVDIGNYLSLEQHNAEHLRWRQINDIYEAEYYWKWKSKGHMAKFEEMRIRSDKLSKYGEYTLGIITLNHIVSSINSLYLSKVSDNLKLHSSIQENNIELQLLFKF